VLVDVGQASTRIERNRANENADDGIDVDSAATILTRNTANHNGDLGIEAGRRGTPVDRAQDLLGVDALQKTLVIPRLA
jgi:parallel beta-helix repeat protein